MQYTEEIDKERKIVIARVSGGMTKEKIAPKTTKTRLRAKELNYCILFDFRKVNNYLTIVDAYYWLAEHYDDLDPTLKFIPTAHVVDTKDEEFSRFVETTFLNRGASIRVFTEESAAIGWLESHRCHHSGGEAAESPG